MARKDHRTGMVEATKELLQKQGYPGTGLKEILEVSGAPKGSLYHYFPGGKEELGEAAIMLSADEILASLSALADLPPVESVDRFTTILTEELERSDYEAGSPIATVALEMSSSSEVLREACRRAYEQWMAEIRRPFLQAGIDPAAAKAASLVAMSCVEGALLLSRVQRSTEPIRVVSLTLKLLTQMVMAGALPQPPLDD
ncbi:MAG: TetR/AcrR family transcriptional regulator [Myxococcales bacterium]|nr:TetR/AcrR family transcriptional regulator [Myxococcales bacterium]